MRSLVLLATVLTAGACASAPARTDPPPPPQPPPGVTMEVFESGLADHGEWVTSARHGRVWRPLRVAASWQPYLYGEWVWTGGGWFWLTDEPWGWATYHYGRWAYDAELGWIWVPGFVWAPAWVAWRVCDGFVGWAPLYPGDAVWWVDAYPLVPAHWIFVETRVFVGVRVEVVAVSRARTARLVAVARPAPPRAGRRPSPAPRLGGPTRPEVERHVGRPLRPAPLVTAPTPAEARRRTEAGAIPVYRPRVDTAPGAGAAARARPAHPPETRPARPDAAKASERAPAAAPATESRPAPKPAAKSGPAPAKRDDEASARPAPARR